MALKFDLIKTIEEDEDVTDYSDDSDKEVEYQPSKRMIKKNDDFEEGFTFGLSSEKEYNADAWNDVAKYIKRKGNTKVDDKIRNARKEMKKEKKVKDENGDISDSDSDSDSESVSDLDGPSDSELSLSEDELKKDDIKVKPKTISKRKMKQLKKENKDNEEDKEEPELFDESTSFQQMNLSRPLLKAITAMNFVHPTPIQVATVPVALLGKDIYGCAATGTGKTAAYMLPILERFMYYEKKRLKSMTRILVLVPTRELGVQVYEVTKQLAQFTKVECGLAVGGLDHKIQKTVLEKKPDIVIATPGRLIDHVNDPSSTFSLEAIEVLVLDEADRMLDENFAEQMKEIIDKCATSRQTMLFSATMTDAVENLAAVSLKNPVKLFVDSNQVVAFNLRQEFIRIRPQREDDREAILAALVCRTFRDHTIVFVRTKVEAHRIRILLGLLGVKVGELHGNLRQPQRLQALKKFKDEEINVLVATDVAARGLDIFGVKTVINFRLPSTVEHYIHRVGRTARAGKAGVSVSLTGDSERKLLKQIVKNATNPVKMRVIPIDIIEKYKVRLRALEDKITGIQEEEQKERADAEAGIVVQSKDKEEGNNSKNEKKKKNKKLKKKDEPTGPSEEEQWNDKMQRIAAFQARISKKKTQTKKIRSVFDNSEHGFPNGRGSKKRKWSCFAEDLTDVSRKGAKRLRYDANVKHKMDKRNRSQENFERKMGMNNKKEGGFKRKMDMNNKKQGGFKRKMDMNNKKQGGFKQKMGMKNKKQGGGKQHGKAKGWMQKGNKKR